MTRGKPGDNGHAAVHPPPADEWEELADDDEPYANYSQIPNSSGAVAPADWAAAYAQVQANRQSSAETITVYPFRESESGGFVMMENDLFDHLMPQLGPAKWAIFCFIFRKLRGWNKESDVVSNEQIAAGTGISVRSAKMYATELATVDKVFLRQKTRKGKDQGPNRYSLNRDFCIVIPDDS